jgi:hypothetical protein
MPSRSASERALIARIASHASWANTADPSARTAPARAGLDRKFELEVDPDGVLPPDDLARRVAHRRKAHFAQLALKSAQARRANKRLTDARAAADELRTLADEIEAAS